MPPSKRLDVADVETEWALCPVRARRVRLEVESHTGKIRHQDAHAHLPYF